MLILTDNTTVSAYINNGGRKARKGKTFSEDVFPILGTSPLLMLQARHIPSRKNLIPWMLFPRERICPTNWIPSAVVLSAVFFYLGHDRMIDLIAIRVNRQLELIVSPVLDSLA